MGKCLHFLEHCGRSHETAGSEASKLLSAEHNPVEKSPLHLQRASECNRLLSRVVLRVEAHFSGTIRH